LVEPFFDGLMTRVLFAIKKHLPKDTNGRCIWSCQPS